MTAGRPTLVGLYVPGDRPDRFGKALAAGADQVIIDLEDAVDPERKSVARDQVAAFLAEEDGGRLAVRVNHLGSPWGGDDLSMLASAPRLPALRLPKTESADDVDRLLKTIRPSSGLELTCLLESALGVENAFAIARHPAVSAIALGEADLRADVGITSEDGLDWLRVRAVVAARAAGLHPPNMSVYPRLDDPDGLAESCRRGAALGMLGRTAIHPRQIPVIRRAFAPPADVVARAESVLRALAGGAGAVRLPDGSMVDEAMAAEARRTLSVRDLAGPG